MSSEIRDVLIYEKDKSALRTLLEIFAGLGIHASTVNKCQQAAQAIENKHFWAVFFDVDSCSSNHSLQNLIYSVKSKNPDCKVILIGSENTAEAGIDAINNGGAFYFARPIDKSKAKLKIKELLLENINPDSSKINANNDSANLVGSSEALFSCVETAKKVAATSAPVMIEGPSGSGKELIAQLIHNSSRRNTKPFIKLNCAAVNETLLQSELFGHEKGAFTGAVSVRKGRFERANNGTLLLDEITETSPLFQAQLLRVLEEGTLERIGGEEEIAVDVRIICTTNRDIKTEVANGNFREDLYYRLSAIKIKTPPLMDRLADIRELVWHFADIFAFESRRNIQRLSSELVDMFENYDWPGNIRQLRNAVRACMALGQGPILYIPQESALYQELTDARHVETYNNETLAGTNLQDIEKSAILATLEHTSGNQRKAAKLLGISDRTLRDKVKRYRNEDALEKVC